MEYRLKDTQINRVVLTDNKTRMNIDCTLSGEIADGELTFPFSEGITIACACPDGLVEEVEKKLQDYFDNKYKSK